MRNVLKHPTVSDALARFEELCEAMKGQCLQCRYYYFRPRWCSVHGTCFIEWCESEDESLKQVKEGSAL